MLVCLWLEPHGAEVPTHSLKPQVGPSSGKQGSPQAQCPDKLPQAPPQGCRDDAPQVFASHAQFKDWFSNPLTTMVDGGAAINRATVERLHSVLRPFLLRRLKADVEKQLPKKHEHVIRCGQSGRANV